MRHATSSESSPVHRSDPSAHLPLIRTREEIEQEIRERVQTERRRLEAQQRQPPRVHFHKPIERPFTAAERSRVTILFGGLTWKHE